MQPIVDAKEARWQQAAKLAEDILGECRVQLMLKFRFMDLALWRMSHEPMRMNVRYPLSTDGKKIYFEPELLLARFQTSFEESVRDYLHMIMHCVMRHPFDKGHGNKEAWFLACDIIVEMICMEMCGDRFESEYDERRRQAISELLLAKGEITPYKLYQFLDETTKTARGKSVPGIPPGGITELQFLFERDNHESWPAVNKGRKSEPTPGPAEPLEDKMGDENEDASMRVEGESEEMRNSEKPNPLNPRNGEEKESEEGDNKDDDGDSSGDAQAADAKSEAEQTAISSEEQSEQTSSSDDAERERKDNDEKTEKEWEDIAKQIEMNLETFSKEWGDEAGSLISSLTVANKKRYDYSGFLKRFMTTSEEMKINDEEFDLIFYTYGLKLYGNMPLIEPLEFKDTQRIRDFVIAVDTSESVRGDLVRRFLEHTFSILKSSEFFGSEVNIHVIQCDARVQADDKITNLNEIGRLMEKFFIRGYGGTDFRPAFDYVERLRKEGELTNLKGMLYFTDGLGRFPEKTPDYDVAFIFMDKEDEAFSPKVPPWAMKVIIDERGIDEFKSKLTVGEE